MLSLKEAACRPCDKVRAQDGKSSNNKSELCGWSFLNNVPALI